MALPDASAPGSPTSFAHMLKSWPGGEHIDPALAAAGPYYLVPITELDNTYFTVHAALDAYPGVDMPSVDGFSRYATIETVSVHAVPQFVHDVLDYHNGDGNFRMSLDAVSGPYATPPAEPEFAEMQARLLGRTQPQMAALADAVQAVTPTLGVAGVAAFILGLGAAALGDPARVAQALAGFALGPSPAAAH